MRGGKVTGRMISDMARESLRASRMRNAFVAVTIALASALLTAIFLFALGQKELEREALSHRQQVNGECLFASVIKSQGQAAAHRRRQSHLFQHGALDRDFVRRFGQPAAACPPGNAGS